MKAPWNKDTESIVGSIFVIFKKIKKYLNCWFNKSSFHNILLEKYRVWYIYYTSCVWQIVNVKISLLIIKITGGVYNILLLCQWCHRLSRFHWRFCSRQLWWFWSVPDPQYPTENKKPIYTLIARKIIQAKLKCGFLGFFWFFGGFFANKTLWIYVLRILVYLIKHV